MSDSAPPTGKRRHQEINETLVRNVLTDPLYGKIIDHPERIYDVMIDANVEYYQGREKVFHAIIALTERALAAVGRDAPADIRLPRSIGSAANPYMSARLPGNVIQKMIETDNNDALAAAAKQHQSEQTSDPQGVAQATHEPSRPGRYRAIYRIWEDFPLTALIDRSCSTVKADAAWRAFLAEGKDIAWAVIDSGIDRLHAHFNELDTLKVSLPLKHWDLTLAAPNNPEGTADIREGADSALVDKLGHGTHVAGIIAGALGRRTQNRAEAIRKRRDPTGNLVDETEQISCITGMAPSCKLISMKVLDDKGNGSVSNIIEAIDIILRINDYGRRLLIHGVNLSVGYEFDPKWFACGQSPLCIEVNRLVRSGVVVVVAAGNTGYGVLQSNQRTTGAGLQLTINDPGNAEFAITVGSTHRDMPHIYGVSYFSSKGPTGDGRRKPDLVAPGERILSCRSTKGVDNAPTNQYVEDSGTSMAAPHVSGVIAAFLSIRREYIGRPEEVKQLFLSNCTDLNRDNNFQGRGLIDLMRTIQAV